MKIGIKRVYEPAEPSDGTRILVDRIWPRGLSKEKAALDLWFREIAPSTGLRKWFAHDPAKWDGFRKKYDAELDAMPEQVEKLRGMAAKGRVTLLYSAHDEECNQAVALLEYLNGGKPCK